MHPNPGSRVPPQPLAGGFGTTSNGGFHAFLALSGRGHRHSGDRSSYVPPGRRGRPGSVGGGRGRRGYHPAPEPSRTVGAVTSRAVTSRAVASGAVTSRAASGPGTRPGARAQSPGASVCPRAQPARAERVRGAKARRERPRAGRLARVALRVVAWPERALSRRVSTLAQRNHRGPRSEGSRRRVRVCAASRRRSEGKALLGQGRRCER
jgi:hypothetical protein